MGNCQVSATLELQFNIVPGAFIRLAPVFRTRKVQLNVRIHKFNVHFMCLLCSSTN